MVHVAASHVRIVEAHVAQVHARQPQARHLQWLDRRVDDLEELCHSQLYRIPLSDLIKLGYQGLYPVEADFFVELIDQLLVVHGQVGVPIAQVVEDVSKVGPIPIDEVSPVLVCRHIVPAREHYCKH